MTTACPSRSSRYRQTVRALADASCRLGGGRRWWAHQRFTRIHIKLTIGKKEVEELMNVKGIGEKSFLKLKPLITVGDSKSVTHQ